MKRTYKKRNPKEKLPSLKDDMEGSNPMPLELTTNSALPTTLPIDTQPLLRQDKLNDLSLNSKIFNVKHMSSEEQLLLTNNGARLFQAQSQEEVNSIIQQALDNKTNDTILIVGPTGRQGVNGEHHILTRNENGEHVITRIMNTDPKMLGILDGGLDGTGIVYQQNSEQAINGEIPETVLQFTSPDQIQSSIGNENIYVQDNQLLEKTHPSVIYEKHLTPDQIQVLTEQQSGRKTKLQSIYQDQDPGSELVSHSNHQILFDNNNNSNGLSQELIKSSDLTESHQQPQMEDHEVIISKQNEEMMDENGKESDNQQIQLIYAPVPDQESDVEQQKGLEIYATTQNDLQNLINSGHQVVVQQSLQYSHQNGAPTVFVVQEMLDDGTDLSTQRRRAPSNPQSPMSVVTDPNSTEVISQVATSSAQSGYIQTRYFDHPLTAATSAMLNISGSANNGTSSGNGGAPAPAPEDESTATSGVNLNSLVPQHQVHQVHNPNGGTTFLYEYYKVPEKDTIQWSNNPTTKLNGQTTPLDVSGLSQNEIQGLLLGSHPSSSSSPSSVAQQQHHHLHNQQQSLSPPSASLDNSQQTLLSSGSPIGLSSIKREPEDLRKEPTKCPSRNQKVLVVQSPSPSSLHIKEQPPSPGSPQTENMYAATPGTQIFLQGSSHQASNLNSNTPSPGPYVTDQYGMYATSRLSSAGGSTFVSEPYYREYFADGQNYVQSARSIYGGGSDVDPNPASAYESRLSGQPQSSESYHHHNNNNNSQSANKNAPIYAKAVTAAGLTVDLPSPDSGIGADAITPRDQNNIQQSFDYTEMCHSTPILEGAGTIPVSVTNIQRAVIHGSEGSPTTSIGQATRSRPWHDFGRQSEADKVQIPKIFANNGFKYHLESPISSSQRREDDRITYINKGQFYGITLEYIHDPEKPLKNQTVKSVIMLMFREEKSPDDEIKAWQFWHSRQHSVKQRILDADTKNSVGIVGCIEEIAHNAIAVYWNPLESSAKINIAVQCLSTDFSSQKGVKGLPLHIQIDTFEDPRDSQVFHRGYCQIKVFCDKGAERKTRDEERRAAKRKMSTTGRKKLDELYHPVTERSEFYAMQDMAKPPVLFSPAEDIEKLSGMDLQSFYGHDPDTFGNTPADIKPFLLNQSTKAATPTLKFHNHFPPDVNTEKNKEHMMDSTLVGSQMSDFGSASAVKRQRMSSSPLCDRVMLYVRQENEDIYTPLHVVPPTTGGLLNAIENKYKISSSSINNLYRKNRKGIIAKIDDDMLSYYCNEDIFLLEVRQMEEDLFDITLTELMG